MKKYKKAYRIEKGVLSKRADRTRGHFLYRPPAIAVSQDILNWAKKEKCDIVQVYEVSEGLNYTSTLEDMEDKGLFVERKHGLQRALPLDRWLVTEMGNDGVGKCREAMRAKRESERRGNFKQMSLF